MIRYYALAVFIILIDQWTKFAVVKNMDLYESIPVIPDVFSITSHRNTGAAWGILEDQFIFFYIVTFIVVAAIVYYMQKYAKQQPLLAISLGLILGGAVGNFIDRLFRKEVVDFLDVMVIRYDFPIFNIADSALTIGVILVILATIIEEKRRKKGEEQL